MNPRPYTHPEIEFRDAELVKRGPIIDADGNTSGDTLVDVLEIYPDRTEWKPNLDHSALADLVPLDKPSKPQPLRIIFFGNLFCLTDHADDQHPYTENNSTGHWMRQFCGVSPIFLSVATRRHGEIRGNGCFVRRDEDGREVALDGFYHLATGKGPPVTVWFSHGLAKDRGSIYIIHKFREDAKRSLLACAQGKDSSLLLRPLAVDIFFAAGALLKREKHWDMYASELIDYENQPKLGMTPVQTTRATENLHRLSQHMYSLQGHLNDFQDTMQHLVTVRRRRAFLLSDRLGREGDNDLTDSVSESMEFLQSRANFIRRWVTIHRERIGIQINLFFNLANQLDSRTNLDIAMLTSKISVSAQRDSSAMITIAIVTMFFLPGTFVSAFFSMVFFDKKTRPKWTPNPPHRLSDMDLFCRNGYAHLPRSVCLGSVALPSHETTLETTRCRELGYVLCEWE